MKHSVLTIACLTSRVALALVEFRPAKVVIDSVTVEYPVTWQRRLFSSVPIREKALNDVSLTLDALNLIKGASSSGKSTLLRTVVATDTVSKGSVVLHPLNNPPTPQYLDSRPGYDSRQMREVLDSVFRNSLGLQQETLDSVASTFAMNLGVPYDEARLSQTVSSLSPSESYRFSLLLACIESSCSCLSETESKNPPAPVLLLDEWMDTETSGVIQAVQDGLWRLTEEIGATVCVVTHREERWKTEQMSRTITLSGGKILHTKMR